MRMDGVENEIWLRFGEASTGRGLAVEELPGAARLDLIFEGADESGRLGKTPSAITPYAPWTCPPACDRTFQPNGA